MVKKLTMFLAALLLTAVGAMAQTQVKGTVVSQEAPTSLFSSLRRRI